MAEKPTQTSDKEVRNEAKEPQTPETPEKGPGEGEQPSKKTEPKGEELPPKVDYKKKFSESTREAQRILEESKLKDEKIAELEVQLGEAKASKPPSDVEIAEKHPDWEYLEEADKTRIRQEEGREQRIRKLEEQLTWARDFKSLVRQEEFASLVKEEDEFKNFAYKYPKEVDLVTIGQAYLYRKGKKAEKPLKELSEQPRKGLEKPTGGQGKVPPPEMTLEDIKRLRETNEKRYIKMIEEGRLKKIPEK